MSEPSPLQAPRDQTVPQEPARQSSLDLRPSRWQPILSGGVTLLVIALLAGGIMWVVDQPVLVPVTGRVTCEGKPLKDAIVTTVPVKGGLGALSALDAEGNFNLETNGADGAYTGEHKFMVKSFVPGTMPPKPLVAVKYLDEATTPLTILVKKGAANHFEFKIDPP
ncbi:MAG: hypothetical protein ACM3U2_02860 [Deltaproteobacteria bacterium]